MNFTEKIDYIISKFKNEISNFDKVLKKIQKFLPIKSRFKRSYNNINRYRQFYADMKEQGYKKKEINTLWSSEKEKRQYIEHIFENEDNSDEYTTDDDDDDYTTDDVYYKLEHEWNIRDIISYDKYLDKTFYIRNLYLPINIFTNDILIVRYINEDINFTKLLNIIYKTYKKTIDSNYKNKLHKDKIYADLLGPELYYVGLLMLSDNDYELKYRSVMSIDERNQRSVVYKNSK